MTQDNNSMYNLFEPMSDSIIKVIGVGGGGSNAVNYMFRQGITGVDFAVCNTDKQALEDSPIQTKVQLGPQLTDGMGAGSIPEVGKQSCIESIEDVRKFLQQNTKMLFVTAGLGGGTGTGAAPIIAKAAKEMDILTVAIVTLPFEFEGVRRTNQAIEGLENLKKCVDSILVISNDRLSEMFGDLHFSQAFHKADDILATAAKGIAEIITVPGYINVDFKDVNTVMKNSGVAIMGYAEAEGDDRARRAINEALNSPLLKDNDIIGAQHILLNISSGKGNDEITMSEIKEITTYIQEEAGFGTDLIWGNSIDDKLGNKVCVTIIATGFDKAKNQEPQKIVVSLDDNESTNDVFDINEDDGPNAHVIEFNDIPNTIDSPRDKTEPFIKEKSSGTNKSIESPPNSRDVPEKSLFPPRQRRAARPIDNPQDLTNMEEEPAYKRKQIELDNNREKRGDLSKLSINLDENDSPIIERNNSFFNKKVD